MKRLRILSTLALAGQLAYSQGPSERASAPRIEGGADRAADPNPAAAMPPVLKKLEPADSRVVMLPGLRAANAPRGSKVQAPAAVVAPPRKAFVPPTRSGTSERPPAPREPAAPALPLAPAIAIAPPVLGAPVLPDLSAAALEPPTPTAPALTELPPAPAVGPAQTPASVDPPANPDPVVSASPIAPSTAALPGPPPEPVAAIPVLPPAPPATAPPAAEGGAAAAPTAPLPEPAPATPALPSPPVPATAPPPAPSPLPPDFEAESAIFLQEKIGRWTLADARTLLGEPARHRPAIDDNQAENGHIYAFHDPTGRYKELELDFDAGKGSLRTVFVYPHTLTWQECRRLFSGNVNATKANKGRTFYSYLNRRLDVLVDPGGQVISLGLY